MLYELKVCFFFFVVVVVVVVVVVGVITLLRINNPSVKHILAPLLVAKRFSHEVNNL